MERVMSNDINIKIEIPERALVLLMGTSGSGKSSFGRAHFKPTEVISSDYCRALIADDENDQTVSPQAFAVLHEIVRQRMMLGKLTVVDATNVQPEARKPLIKLAQEYHMRLAAIVFKLPARVCLDRNSKRPDRQFGSHVIRRQNDDLRRSLNLLKREGFAHVHILESEAEVNSVALTRTPMWPDKHGEHGPFDIIGDIHGCFDELCDLLAALGWERRETDAGPDYVHPGGRMAVFLGDLVDRGDQTPEVLALVMRMVESGVALCVPGNHDIKLVRKLNGRDVKVSHGLQESLDQLAMRPPEFVARARQFLDNLVSHYVLDDGKLVVAHAGMKALMQGRGSPAVREFALYGETTGETDEFGLTVRYNWALDYKGRAMVVYGHTPVPEPEWLNNTINIDTGCVFGGKLTALRYPERETVQIDARRVYAEPLRPLTAVETPALSVQQTHDDMLDLTPVLGRMHVQTRLMPTVIVAHEHAVTALEVMSRFAINPKWLAYLPPTMSPTESHRGEQPFLEYPSEAFGYYASEGVTRVVCEEKHMGSRAIVAVCRDEDAARRRFGVIGEGIGTVYTRTGRRFFDDLPTEQAFVARVRDALGRAGWWERFSSDWFLLDCELMPWSAKAQGLLREQYAAVGAAARAAMRDAVAALRACAAPESADVLPAYAARAGQVDRFVEAYARYCWPVATLDDYKLAPFQLLASEGAMYFDKDHAWHMQTLGELCAADPGVLRPTRHRVVDLTNPEDREAATAWWLAMTEAGGEGMVVKPFEPIMRGAKGLAQPGVKVRGREYLRIIYGPEYDAPEHLNRLRVRSVHGKRRLALREFALGVEALERFNRREALARVHECVFGVLALESEPMDPRL
jgi:protein phosphatase